MELHVSAATDLTTTPNAEIDLKREGALTEADSPVWHVPVNHQSPRPRTLSVDSTASTLIGSDEYLKEDSIGTGNSESDSATHTVTIRYGALPDSLCGGLPLLEHFEGIIEAEKRFNAHIEQLKSAEKEREDLEFAYDEIRGNLAGEVVRRFARFYRTLDKDEDWDLELVMTLSALSPDSKPVSCGSPSFRYKRIPFYFRVDFSEAYLGDICKKPALAMSKYARSSTGAESIARCSQDELWTILQDACFYKKGGTRWDLTGRSKPIKAQGSIWRVWDTSASFNKGSLWRRKVVTDGSRQMDVAATVDSKWLPDSDASTLVLHIRYKYVSMNGVWCVTKTNSFLLLRLPITYVTEYVSKPKSQWDFYKNFSYTIDVFVRLFEGDHLLNFGKLSDAQIAEGLFYTKEELERCKEEQKQVNGNLLQIFLRPFSVWERGLFVAGLGTQMSKPASIGLPLPTTKFEDN
ncbi:hypothetical protein BJ508DRAFT_309873 [Ascobolus immersus RN42]|uniref:Uncharacterized protein n=1 Tax=Ascobolus immersus RN42 TaxID=1160509 RepID=A0A3N4I0Y0_ASCIM|nr:hypothetical protein BJ508DRAFT_309873 [Ascobolus immersus RN42]